jgi:hypothetical protein
MSCTTISCPELERGEEMFGMGVYADSGCGQAGQGRPAGVTDGQTDGEGVIGWSRPLECVDVIMQGGGGVEQ